MSRLLAALANSGLVVNHLGFARALQRLPALSWLLRLRLSPEILVKLNELPSDEESGLLYAAAVSRMRTGTVVKAVDPDRNALTDECVLRLVRGEGLARICDVGASDGSASLRLLKELPGVEVRLFDRFTFFLICRRPLGCEILNADGEPVYRRVGPFLFYVYGQRAPRERRVGCGRVEIRNPLLRPLNARVEPLDVFAGTAGVRFQLIKCCNLLNDDYFSGETLIRGVENLLRQLEENGYLVIGQNNPSYRQGEAFLVLKRVASGTRLVEARNDHKLLALLRRERPEFFRSGP